MRYLFIALLLIMAGCSKETIEEPAKPTKPTRDQIADFCSDTSTIEQASRSKESTVKIARDVGMEGDEDQLGGLYVAVLMADMQVIGTQAANSLNAMGGASGTEKVPVWEKACAKSVRERIAEWD